MKVLFYDLRDSEKNFLNSHKYMDFSIKYCDESLNEKTQISDIDREETSILCVYRSSILNSKVLEKFKNLRIIATRSFGFNHIDLEYCTNHNIIVIHTDQYGEEAVAEYALGLILALTRNIKPALFDIHNKVVDPKKYEGQLLMQKTIGIIGCGKVGIKLGKIADFFGMKVLVSSYKEEPKFDKFCNIVPFDKLLSNSDIIALHMPFTTSTYQILGKDEFEKMKKGVYIINTSCVDLIDTEALYNGLKSGKVRGAGLDILDSDFGDKDAKKLKNETMSSKENHKITSKLIDLPNVIITPHIAYNTEEYIEYVLETTMNSIRDNIKGICTNRVV